MSGIPGRVSTAQFPMDTDRRPGVGVTGHVCHRAERSLSLRQREEIQEVPLPPRRRYSPQSGARSVVLARVVDEAGVSFLGGADVRVLSPREGETVCETLREVFGLRAGRVSPER